MNIDSRKYKKHLIVGTPYESILAGAAAARGRAGTLPRMLPVEMAVSVGSRREYTRRSQGMSPTYAPGARAMGFFGERTTTRLLTGRWRSRLVPA